MNDIHRDAAYRIYGHDSNPLNPITRKGIICRNPKCSIPLNPGEWVSVDGYCAACDGMPCQHLGDIVPATRTLPAYCCSCGEDIPDEQDEDMFDEPEDPFLDDKIDRLKEARREGH